MFCKYCGKPTEPLVRFCRHCGEKVSSIDTKTQNKQQAKSSGEKFEATPTIIGVVFWVLVVAVLLLIL
jgi:uncharacterized membrane protein YvbJ